MWLVRVCREQSVQFRNASKRQALWAETLRSDRDFQKVAAYSGRQPPSSGRAPSSRSTSPASVSPPPGSATTRGTGASGAVAHRHNSGGGAGSRTLDPPQPGRPAAASDIHARTTVPTARPVSAVGGRGQAPSASSQGCGGGGGRCPNPAKCLRDDNGRCVCGRRGSRSRSSSPTPLPDVASTLNRWKQLDVASSALIGGIDAYQHDAAPLVRRIQFKSTRWVWTPATFAVV